MGRMVITILGMVADMGLKFIKDRQRAGIEAARAEGVYKGRKKNVDDDEIRRLLAAGASKARVARDLKVSRMTVYRALRSEEHTSELQSLMRISYAVFCLKKKKKTNKLQHTE